MDKKFLIALSLLCAGSAHLRAQEPGAGFTPEDGVYYRIGSASDSLAGRCVADNTASPEASYKFAVTAEAAGDDSQLWSLWRDASSGLLRLVNKATGNTVAASSEAAGAHNAVLAGSASDTACWAATPVGGGQYALHAVEDDGVERWLCAATPASAPDTLDEARLAGTSFAWVFVPDGTPVGVGRAMAPGVSVSVSGGVISVAGRADYSVTAADGVRMPRGARLPKGVYMVTAGGKTTKVTIR